MGFGDLFRGISNGVGSLLNSGAQGLGKAVNGIGNGIGSLVNNFSQAASGNSGSGGINPYMFPNMGQGMGQQQGSQGGLSSLFNGAGGKAIGSGLAGIFGSQLIKNPSPPQMPQSFMNFQNQANQGGPPITQQSNQYMQSILNGQNTDANDAATHSLDLNYQEQLRQLNGMYKSLRPGTDPTSDTTYQRDLNNLNDMYTRQRAQVLSQQQQGAAQYGLQAGTEQANQQMAGVEAEVNRMAAQYGLDAQTKAALRNQLMSMGGNIAMLGGIQSLFPNAYGNGAK